MDKIAMMLLPVLLILAIGVSIGYTNYVQGQSNRQWCGIIELIVSVPVAKPANPDKNVAREKEYQLYEDFLQRERTLACPTK